MPLFTKAKYFSIFSDILMNIKSILKKENDSKIKLIFEDKLENVTNNNKNSIKLNCKRYIEKIENSILKNTRYKGIKLSEIEYLYLKNLSINYKRKIDLISIKTKEKKDYILNLYLQLCKKMIILNNNLQNKELYFNQKHSVLNNIEINILKEQEEKNVNIYIGKFNMKKFPNQEQIVHL